MTGRHVEGWLDAIKIVQAGDGVMEISIVGWVLHSHEEIRALSVTINKGLPTESPEIAHYGVARGDVVAVFPHVPHALNCGFNVLFRTRAGVEDIKNVGCTAVLSSGETCTHRFVLPKVKTAADRIADVTLPSEDGKLVGFLEKASFVYVGEGKTGLLLIGWMLHAEKTIKALAFTARLDGKTWTSTNVRCGIEHSELDEPFRKMPQAESPAFLAVFESCDLKKGDIPTFHARVTFEDEKEQETVFRPIAVQENFSTLISPGRDHRVSYFCFGEISSIRKVWLGKGRIGYYVTGWLLVPHMTITDVRLLTDNNTECEMFHFGYPFHSLETAYPNETGSKGWFSGLFQIEDRHAAELKCRMAGRMEDGPEFVIEFPGQTVDTAYFHGGPDRNDSSPRRTVGIHQCYYDEQMANRLDPAFIPYFNHHVSRFFENAVIAELIRDGKHRAWDYFGVFSWRFSEKVPLRSDLIFDLMHEHGYEADVYSFFDGPVHNTWAVGGESHPGLIQAAEVLFDRLGMRFDLLNIPTPIIYQNHFICRSELYERYVRELLEPAIRVMSNSDDQELQGLLGRSAQYVISSDTALRLAEAFGRGYFSLEPFVCERLFSTWAALQSLRVHHIFCARIPGQ